MYLSMGKEIRYIVKIGVIPEISFRSRLGKV